MTRAMIMADSGDSLAALTLSLADLERMEIVRHASGRAPVGALVKGIRPDIVLIHALLWPGLTLARIAEIRAGAPSTAVVVVAERVEAVWLADALIAEADAIVPAIAGKQTLQLVVDEAIAAHVDRSRHEPAALVA